MSSLADNELREKLREYGFEPGPITPSTKKVYERKLERLIKESRGGSSTPSRPRINVSQPVDLVKKEDLVSPHVLRQLNWASFGSGTGEHVFSPSSHSQSLHPSQLSSPSSPNFVSQQNPGHTPTAGPRAPLRAVNANVVYDSPSLSSEVPRVIPKYSTPSGVQSRPSSGDREPISLTGQFHSRELNPNAMRDADTSTSNSLLLTPKTGSRQSFWSGWQPRASSAGSCFMSDESNSDSADINHWISHSEKVDNRSRAVGPNFDNSMFSRFFGLSVGSHVPNLILLCGTILFAVIASSYLLLKDKHGNVGRIADFQKVICHSNDPYDRDAVAIPEQSTCINDRDLPLVLKIVHPLFEILSRFAGEYRCGESVESSRMEVGTAKRLVKGYFASDPVSHILESQVDTLWRSVLFLITEVGRKHLEIAVYDGDGLHPTCWQDVQELESLRPYIPGSCRLRLLFFSLLHFLSNLFWLLVTLSIVGGVCYAIYRVKLSHQNRTSKRETRVREVVHQVIGLLQQQLHVRQTHPTEPPYVPVSVIKETLGHTNKDLADLWKDVEHHVHLVEGCILVQEWRGIGETWQWQGGSGWQGSALPDKSQRLPFTTPPTECLKVRNMFTRDTFDSNAERRLKRELLNHIAGCGAILHIGLDYQNNQGLVYIKCASPAVAGRVYEAIHANYFDSHLLTVKFLRAAKYYLRFPEACDAVTPLKAPDFE